MPFTRTMYISKFTDKKKISAKNVGDIWRKKINMSVYFLIEICCFLNL